MAAEITSLADFETALKQRFQDPYLVEKASRIIETLYRKDLKFNDFITIFKNNCIDSIYGNLEIRNWKVMLER